MQEGKYHGLLNYLGMNNILQRGSGFISIYFLAFNSLVSQNVNLYYKNPLPNGTFESLSQAELFTGEVFQAHLNIPNITQDCDMVEVTYTLPNNVVFVSLPNTAQFQVVNTTGLLKIKSLNTMPINGAMNLVVSLKIKDDGTVCEGVPSEITALIDYFNKNTGSCQSSINVGALTVIPKYDDDTTIIDGFCMNPNDICTGGYASFHFQFTSVNRFGGYNISNINAELIFTGDFLDLQNESGSLPCNITNLTNCQKKVTFSTSNLNVDDLAKKINLVFNPNCGCSIYSATPSIAAVELILHVSNPCGVIETYNKSISQNIIKNCCASGGVVTPYFGTNITDICNNRCKTSYLSNTYTNSNSPFTIRNYTVEQEILPEMDMISIFSNKGVINSPNTFPVEISYQTNVSSTWTSVSIIESPYGQQEYIPFSEFVDPGIVYSMIFSKPVGSRITRIKWKYLYDIPAWSTMNNWNYFTFLVDDNAQPLSPIPYTVSFERWIGNTHQEDVYFTGNSLPNPYICTPQYGIVYGVRTANSLQNYTNCFPTNTVRLHYRITNSDVGTEPTTLRIELPHEVSFQGNISYYSGPQTASASPYYLSLPQTSLPANESVQYDPVTHALIWTDLSVAPICNNERSCKILEFDVKINSGTIAGTYKPNIFLGDLNPGGQSMIVGEKLLVKGYISRQCPGGAEVKDDIEVSAGEEIQLNYIIRNEGNVPARDFLISSMVPSIGDYTFHANNANNLSRNSELDFSFSQNQSPSGQFQLGFFPSVSDVAVFQGQNNNTNEKIFQAKTSGILAPGNELTIPIIVKIPQTATLGQLAFGDFYFYGYDASVSNTNLPVSGASELTNFKITTINNCPVESLCKAEDDLENRLDGAFDFAVNGHEVTVVSNNLLGNDRWFPIWTSVNNGGSGYQWGNGPYASTHIYDTPGSYEICIVVENKQQAGNENSELCHCNYICKKVEIP